MRQWTDHHDWNDSEPEYSIINNPFYNLILEWDHPTEGHIEVEMWESAGQEAFEQLRKLSYPGTDIYLVGYACNERSSLNNIQHKWLLELKEVDADPWFIIVGTKCDLRAADSGKAVPQEDAEKMAKECDACAFVDTSAKTEEGMEELKNIILELALKKHQGEQRPTAYVRISEEEVEMQLNMLKGDCKSEAQIDVQIRTDSGQVSCRFPEDTIMAVALGDVLVRTGHSLLTLGRYTLSLGGELLDISSTLTENGICDGGVLTLVNCEKSHDHLAIIKKLHEAALANKDSTDINSSVSASTEPSEQANKEAADEQIAVSISAKPSNPLPITGRSQQLRSIAANGAAPAEAASAPKKGRKGKSRVSSRFVS